MRASSTKSSRSLTAIQSIEEERVRLQTELDQQKTQSERNRLGQFSTPPNLASEILSYAATLVSDTQQVRFLDPAFGTGAFYSALRREFSERRIEEALGIEIDAQYAGIAAQLWKSFGLQIRTADFVVEKPTPTFNLVICNPPYVRHHHLRNSEKQQLRKRTDQASGIKLSGLAGLYCHFIGLSHAWMAPDAVAGWLIPSQFMDVNYGHTLKEYLLNRVTLLHIHRFDPSDVQFSDALVSSAIVWFRNTPPPEDHRAKFTYGGSLLKPRLTGLLSLKSLANEHKWTRFPASQVRQNENVQVLSQLFRIKRGLATGDNRYFIMTEADIERRKLPMEVFRPILPSPRYLHGNEIKSLANGTPDLERRLFLLDTRLSESEIEHRWPELHAYLEEGKQRDLHLRYLCRHRAPWYAQEDRPPAPIVCTYLGRSDKKDGRPFRFILNHSQATVANVYLAMYPTPLLARAIESDPDLLRQIWNVLNKLEAEQLLSESRLYGGGLHKLEPGELGRVDAEAIFLLLPDFKKVLSASAQMEFFSPQLG